MNLLLLLPVIALAEISNHSAIHFSSTFTRDTTTIVHHLDGNTEEWPGEKFTYNKETKISYAIDNDQQTLFLALSIPDNEMQKRVMMQGMNLYIDTKGKKKENRGIAFPIKVEEGVNAVKNLGNMKIFGFANMEVSIQNIKTGGAANIAYAWDSLNIMHIEYNIPLKLIDEVLLLNNKSVSIGWKINGLDPASTNSQPVAVTSRVVAVTVPAGSTPPGNRNPGFSKIDPTVQSTTDKSVRAQSIWATYTISFQN